MMKSAAKNSLIIHISRPVRTLIRRFSFAVLLLVALATVFLFNSDNSSSRAVKGEVVDATAPVASTMATPFNFFINIGQSFRTYFFVHSKNEALQKENNELRKRVISLTGAMYENESLKRLLNYVKESTYRYVSAKVMGNAINPLSNSVVINAGARDGIKKGQAVINEYGLVGRVTELYESTSRVLLITDINSNIPVMTLQSREKGIMSGNNTASPEVIYLPVSNKVENGEVLITSGDGGIFPEGLQVGVIFSDDKGAYYANSFVDLSRLEHVSVVDFSE